MITKTQQKTLSKIDMVIIYKKRYFGIDFSKRKTAEISFDEALGHDFFDWDNMICLASDYNSQRYDEMRGQDGLGFGEVCKIALAELNKEVKK